MAITDGGPVFPQLTSEGSVDGYGVAYTRLIVDDPGMSLRDYFAGQALLLVAREERNYAVEATSQDVIARHAYTIADAMLAEREKAR